MSLKYIIQNSFGLVWRELLDVSLSQRPPVIKDHFFVAEGVVSDDGLYCIKMYSNLFGGGIKGSLCKT